jgi:Tfp pilus assembly protein FimT
MRNNQQTTSRGEGENGVSLLETVMVCVLVAIMIAISLPAVAKSIRAYNLRSAAERVAERLAGARALAMAKNKNVTASFQTNASGNVTQYGYDFSPVAPDGTVAPDGIPDTSDPDAPSQSYYAESVPSGITMSFAAGGKTLTNGKGITYTSRGELPIGDSQADITLSNSQMTTTVSVNLRGQVWVH